jgi:glycosyltransferase involved in cell wall biosynthesis
MRIAVIHNQYRQAGGEDAVFSAETNLIRSHGHEVFEYVVSNRNVKDGFRSAGEMIWSPESYNAIRALLYKHKPEVAHFHNTFLAISPSVYYASQAQGVPVVQSLHNYRLLCPVAIFYRDGQICEECLHRFVPWPGIVHACYHTSRSQTAAVAGMITVHRLLGTWTRKVDLFIASSRFAHDKFVQGGIPDDRIVVKPNFIEPDIGLGAHSGEFALFIGRLSPEKGIVTLLQAWERLPEVPLRMVGDGPLQNRVQAATLTNPRISYLGRLDRDSLVAQMKAARFLVFPSESFEGFPMTIAEAFACGLPVVGSGLGSTREIIAKMGTGIHFVPGDPLDLADKVRWAWEHPVEMAEMGRNARREYEEKYTADKNYDMLMAIYQKAIENHNRKNNGV